MQLPATKPTIPAPISPVTVSRTARLKTYKVLMAGDGSVGKSTLLYRRILGYFEPSRQMTIGLDIHTQIVRLNDEQIKLAIWDIGGQDRFSFLRRSFYRGAQAAALVFDVSDGDTLHTLTLWRDEILKIAPTCPDARFRCWKLKDGPLRWATLISKPAPKPAWALTAYSRV